MSHNVQLHPALTQSARRAAVAMRIEQATGAGMSAALILADALDAVCGALLSAAGVDEDTARVVLGDLWQPSSLTVVLPRCPECGR